MILNLTVDPSSPIPLYHQIAEMIRYRVATGEIPVGAVLPPLRDAAGAWGVNLHTVRRAYAELAGAGIVATRAPVGTQVLPPVGRSLDRAGDARARFVRKTIAEARVRHGLGLGELIAMIEKNGAPPASRSPSRVYVSECSETQSIDLARQLEDRWRVTALPWPISREEPPSRDPIVATYFHYNDLRARWPERFPSIRFAAIRPDPELGQMIRARRRGAKGRLKVILCEKEEPMLHNIAADISRVLPADRFHLTTRLEKRSRHLMEGIGPGTSVLVTPRIWGDLPESIRRDPRIHEVRYLFDLKEMESIGRDLAWASR
jgi:GntR family transcriptional regulator